MNEHNDTLMLSGSGSSSDSSSGYVAPDIETASEAYANRFSGEVGKFFLDRQFKVVRSMLGPSTCSILEVGGGHIQLTPYLLEAGYNVCVQGSAEQALASAKKLAERFPDNLTTVASPLTKLPFDDKSFDVVICIRLLCHMESWQDLIKELCRVSKHTVILDYPPQSSFNCLYPLLFDLKAAVEGDTRTYLRFTEKQVLDCFEMASFRSAKKMREFFFPMVMHRVMKRRSVSAFLERLAAVCGLTQLMGSPVMMSATYYIAESLNKAEML